MRLRFFETRCKAAPAALFCFLVLFGAMPSAGWARDAAPAAAAWRRDALWDDGNAEFCVYDVTWSRYGTHYPGRALLVLVKEPWAPEQDVKADSPRPDGFEVLKLNHIRDVATGIYTYHQMASVYFRRDDATLVKLATTSSEACGISTALMVEGQLQTHSYFDGQGDRSLVYPEGALPEDGLPALLRDWVDGDPEARLEIFPSLLSGYLPELEAVTYEVSRQRGRTAEVAAGGFEVVELRLSRGAHWLSYQFSAAAPHLLVRFESSDGTRYELAKCERIRYWKMNRPGGEEWLPEELR